MDNSKIWLLGIVCVVGGMGFALSSELKDPRDRDEDISATDISVNVTQLPDGIYEYVVSLESSSQNRGTILGLTMDIGCEHIPAAFEFKQAPDPSFRHPLSSDGLHARVQPYRVEGRTGPPSISVDNQLGWMVLLRPGERVDGLKILSPAPPVPRSYRILPQMDADGWDYSNFPEDGSPWLKDFIVQGMSTGPACTEDVQDDAPRFEGTRKTGSENNCCEYLPILFTAPGFRVTRVFGKCCTRRARRRISTLPLMTMVAF